MNEPVHIYLYIYLFFPYVCVYEFTAVCKVKMWCDGVSNELMVFVKTLQQTHTRTLHGTGYYIFTHLLLVLSYYKCVLIVVDIGISFVAIYVFMHTNTHTSVVHSRTMDMNISVDGGDIYAGHRVANGHLSAMIILALENATAMKMRVCGLWSP